MKYFDVLRKALVALLCLMLLWPAAAHGDSIVVTYAPGVLLVGVSGAARSDAARSDLLRRAGATSAQTLFTDRTVVVLRVQLPDGADVLAAAARLRAVGAIFAEPDYLARAADDPLFSAQWGLSQIDAPAAWSVVTNTASTIIAVIDSGIDVTHPDLASQLWTNPGEIPANGVDDDGNGYVDDVHGWNFIAGTNDVDDDSGHGTQVAGIAAAAENGVGVIGVCPGCRLMIVKVMRPNGTANYSDIAAGVAYARANGAQVINLSLGGYSDSSTLRAAVAAAARDAVIVAAAGNDAESQPFYPAALPAVLSVAATQRNDIKAEFSNYGEWVQTAAPGEDIVTTALGGGWVSVRGTSSSASFVAGVAALIHAQHPGWTPALARAHLLQTARSLVTADPIYGSQLGYGMPNAGAAVQAAQPRLSIARVAVNGVVDGRPAPGADATLAVTLRNDWLDADDVVATLSTSDPYVTVLRASSNFGVMQTDGEKTGATFSIRISSLAGYLRTIPFRLRITANGGAYDETRTFDVTTRNNEELVCGYAFGTWTEDKTYIVVCDIQVPEGNMLRIEPGAHVLFRGNHSFNVYGALVADGTDALPVTFAPESGGRTWRGLVFEDSAGDVQTDAGGAYESGNLLRHVAIRGASEGVRCDGATPYISNVTIDGGGLTCRTGEGALTPGLSGATLLRTRKFHTTRFGEANPTIFVAAPFDYDGDGDQDLAVGYGANCGRNAIYLNDGAGNFDEKIEFGPESVCTKAIAWGDFNADGRPDLVVGNWGEKSRVYLNAGSGTFLELAPLDGADMTTSIVTGDFDRDGDLDIVTGNHGQRHVIYYNNGGGGFSSSAAFGGTNEYTTSMVSADFDHDGDLDIAVGNDSVGIGLDSVVYWNDGNGVFAVIGNSWTYIPATGYVLDIAAGDVNGDGNVDLAIAHMWNVTGVWQQGADRSFERSVQLGLGTDSADSVALGDADGDGSLDLAVGWLYMTKTLYLNDGVGGLTAAAQFGDWDGGLNLVWFDADGDGDLDLFGGSDYANASLYFNEMSSPLWIVESAINGDVSVTGRAAVLNSAVSAGDLHISGDAIVRGNSLSGGGGIIVDAEAIVERNEVTGASGAALTSRGVVTATANRFISDTLGVIASAGLVSGNLIANSTGVALRVGEVMVTGNTFIGNRGNVLEIQGAAPIAITDNNFEGNDGTFDVYVDLAGRVQIDMLHNWWGAKSNDEIAARIYDFQENRTRATVMYAPVLSEPAADAPAYVRSVTVLPDAVVGIQMATFDVEFSRPMQPDLTRFLRVDDLPASGFTDAAWTTPNRFSVKYDVTARVPRGPKAITIAGAVGTDGIEIAPADGFSFTVDYAAFAADDTPPSSPNVAVISDGATDRLTLRWSAIESDSSITAWRYAIGTTPGGTDVVDWTPVDVGARGGAVGMAGTAGEFSIVRSGLNLQRGARYYGSAQACNAGGLWSEVGVSEDVVGGEVTGVATPTPATPMPATPMPATPTPATPMPATPTPATPMPEVTSIALDATGTSVSSLAPTRTPAVGIVPRVWAPVVLR